MSATDRHAKAAYLRRENDELRRERNAMICINAELLNDLAEMREARDAAVLVAGVYQAQADALAERIARVADNLRRVGQVDKDLLLEMLGG